jgi:hypothetical protein
MAFIFESQVVFAASTASGGPKVVVLIASTASGGPKVVSKPVIDFRLMFPPV